MERVKIIAISMLLSLLYLYLSIYLMGIGAAVAIPESFIQPMLEQSPVLALAVIDLITIGIPLIALYFVMALIIRQFTGVKKSYPYIIVLLPLFAYYIIELFAFSLSKDVVNSFVIILPRYIAIIGFAIWFIKSATKTCDNRG